MLESVKRHSNERAKHCFAALAIWRCQTIFIVTIESVY